MNRQQFVQELWVLYERAANHYDWEAALMFLEKIAEHGPDKENEESNPS